jgi:hypothetical protein
MVAGMVCAATVVVLHLLVHPLVALGFAGGVVTGAGMLSALIVVLNKVMVPPQERSGPQWPWLLLHVGKFAVVGVLAFALIVVLKANAVAFAVGYTIALIILLVIVGGRRDTHTGGSLQD